MLGARPSAAAVDHAVPAANQTAMPKRRIKLMVVPLAVPFVCLSRFNKRPALILTPSPRPAHLLHIPPRLTAQADQPPGRTASIATATRCRRSLEADG